MTQADEVPPSPHLRLYVKAACPLCDEALEAVEDARRETDFTLESVDILADPELYRRYRHAIPVGELDGREIFRFRTTPAEVLRAIHDCRGPSSTVIAPFED